MELLGAMRKKGFGLEGVAPYEFHKRAVRSMDECGMGKEHHRAIAFDDSGTLQAAELDGMLVIGFVLHTLVDPNIPNFGFITLANRLISYLRRARYHHGGLHGRCHVADTSKALAPVDVFGLGIHWDGVVSVVQKFVKQQSGEMLGIARDPYKGDPLALQESGNIAQ
jgi:hypothetical protein